MPCTPTPISIPGTGGGGGFGPLGWILALLIIVVCFGGGFFFFFFNKGGGPDDGSDKMGAQPHMNDGSIGNPDLLDGSDRMGAQPHMNDGSDQALDFHVKGSTDASNQFQKADNQFIKGDHIGGAGGEQL